MHMLWGWAREHNFSMKSTLQDRLRSHDRREEDLNLFVTFCKCQSVKNNILHLLRTAGRTEISYDIYTKQSQDQTQFIYLCIYAQSYLVTNDNLSNFSNHQAISMNISNVCQKNLTHMKDLIFHSNSNNAPKISK